MENRWMWNLILVCTVLFQVSVCVTITELRVPAVVEHDTNSTAILDCEYDLGDEDVRLVIVKWYFNDESHQVYQWGLGLPPSDSGVLKGRTHLGHVASPHPLQKHRAISITNPTMELSGQYICKVFTDQRVATAAKAMVVYVPAREMNITLDELGAGGVNVSCWVYGVFPTPLLKIVSQPEGSSDSGPSLEGVQRNVELAEDGTYAASAHRLVSGDQLTGPTKFSCVLTLKDTPYTLARHTSYGSEIRVGASTSGAADAAGRGAAAAGVAVGLLASCLLKATTSCCR